MPSKKKKPEIEEDDAIRRLITHHLKEAEEELGIERAAKDRAPIVDAICEYVGDPLHDLIRGACDLLLAIDDEEEDEEEDEDEDEEDEDEDEE